MDISARRRTSRLSRQLNRGHIRRPGERPLSRGAWLRAVAESWGVLPGSAHALVGEYSPAMHVCAEHVCAASSTLPPLREHSLAKCSRTALTAALFADGKRNSRARHVISAWSVIAFCLISVVCCGLLSHLLFAGSCR